MLWHKYDWSAATAIPAVVFLLGLCISATAGWWVKRDIDTKAEATFQHSVDRVSAEISRRFRQPLYGLQGARGMYAANPQITRAQFRAYVDSRDLAREFPGVNGFGFVKRVLRTELDAFLVAERADDAPQFGIRKLGDQNILVPRDLYIIKFIEPLGHNFAAFGLDLGSERLRQPALNKPSRPVLPRSARRSHWCRMNGAARDSCYSCRCSGKARTQRQAANGGRR